ncbi:neutral zinc metallopeptidase [Saccharopolyspora taberi]|uniref:Neutral zinc metallopeptidase n=2 Tax=Saccharopolyspora taberi TaxID=60895 RepID=A0ABN3V522_9PSEU
MLTAALAVLAACAPPPGVDPAFVHGTDRGDSDRLAAAVVTDAQSYWESAFPKTFGRPWRPLDGGFFSVDTNDQRAKPPPCSGDVKDVEGNAYYCATVDAVAWDRAALLPVLREKYGDAAVAVVLAHELGHAVQQRARIESDDQSRLEAGADCYAGAFLRWVTDGRSEHLRFEPEALDGAMRALIVFRDPISADQPTDPHGTAFDRVGAFQDGYREGPGRCTQLPDLEAAAPEEPNRPVYELLGDRSIEAYFADLVTRRGGRWTPPAPPTDRNALDALDHDIGDQAVVTLLAARHAEAARDALRLPTSAACLTGAYTRSASLSPGDLDEAVEYLLTAGDPPLDAQPAFERIAAFRAGALGGEQSCG